MSLEAGLASIETEDADQLLFKLEERQYFQNLIKNIGPITWESLDLELAKSTGSSWLDEILFKNNSSLKNQVQHIQTEDIIELVGPPACGKSSIIYEVVANTLLPASWAPLVHSEGSLTSSTCITLHGKGKCVIFFDCDMRIDIRRIYDILFQKISQKLIAQNCSVSELDCSVKQLANACLRKLFVFRPNSASQLLNIIAGLPMLSETNFGLLIIDSLTQFYWATKCSVTLLAKNQHYSFQQDLAQVLKTFLSTQGAIAIVSSWPPFPRRAQAKSTLHDFSFEENEVEDSLNSTAWIHAVNYRLTLKPGEVPHQSTVEIYRSHPLSCPRSDVVTFKLDYYGLIKQ